MKDYLSHNERVELLFLKKYIDNIEKMLESNNVTKEEHKSLEMAKTWGMKAFNSKAERLNDTALKTFWNSIKDVCVNVEDKYSVKMFNTKMHTNIDETYEQNRDYYKLVELIMDNNCKNCRGIGNKCEVYEQFENHCIPDSDEAGMGKCDNCKYAYREVTNG